MQRALAACVAPGCEPAQASRSNAFAVDYIGNDTSQAAWRTMTHEQWARAPQSFVHGVYAQVAFNTVARVKRPRMDSGMRHQGQDPLGILRMSSVPVAHCRDAKGLVLDLHDGTRIVYDCGRWNVGARVLRAQLGVCRFSGDTRPCEALVRAGFAATLLIHEVRCIVCAAPTAMSLTPWLRRLLSTMISSKWHAENATALLARPLV